jgi:hypothetical protein
MLFSHHLYTITGALGEEGEESKNPIIEKIAKRSMAVCPKVRFR